MPQSSGGTQGGGVSSPDRGASPAGAPPELGFSTTASRSTPAGCCDGAKVGEGASVATAWASVTPDDGHTHRSAAIAADVAKRRIVAQISNWVSLSGPGPLVPEDSVSVGFILSTQPHCTTNGRIIARITWSGKPPNDRLLSLAHYSRAPKTGPAFLNAGRDQSLDRV